MLHCEVARLFVDHEGIFRQLGVTREMLERSAAGASAPEFGSEGWRALARAETREEIAAADLYIRQEGLFRQLGVPPGMVAKAFEAEATKKGDRWQIPAAVAMAEDEELETWASQIYDLQRDMFQKMGVTEKMLVDAVIKKHQGATMEEFMAWLEQLGLADSFRKAVTVVRPRAR